MTEPRYVPQFIFSTLPVTQEIECFFCLEPITPTEHETYFVAAIPSGDNPLSLHDVCFEELAWMMLNYYVEYVRSEKNPSVN